MRSLYVEWADNETARGVVTTLMSRYGKHLNDFRRLLACLGNMTRGVLFSIEQWTELHRGTINEAVTRCI